MVVVVEIVLTTQVAEAVLVAILAQAVMEQLQVLLVLP